MYGRRQVHPNFHVGNTKVAHWTGTEWAILDIEQKFDTLTLFQNVSPDQAPSSLEPGGMRWCSLCRAFVDTECRPSCPRQRLQQLHLDRARERLLRSRRHKLPRLVQRYRIAAIRFACAS